MSITAWILFLVLVAGMHLLMHRGHGVHGRRGSAPASSGGDDAHGGATNDAGSTTETEPRHRHHGC